MPGGVANPVRQRGTIQIDTLAGVDLGLPIQRQMVGIFGHQNLGDGRLGRQSALDQPGWGRGLQDTVLARAAGVFGPQGDEHPELRRHDVEPLALVLADPVQLALATGADLVIDIDDELDPRQMRWQCTPVAAALAPAPHDHRAYSSSAPLAAAACSTSSRPSSICSSGSVSALRPKRCRCNSLMI